MGRRAQRSLHDGEEKNQTAVSRRAVTREPRPVRRRGIGALRRAGYIRVRRDDLARRLTRARQSIVAGGRPQ